MGSAQSLLANKHELAITSRCSPTRQGKGKPPTAGGGLQRLLAPAQRAQKRLGVFPQAHCLADVFGSVPSIKCLYFPLPSVTGSCYNKALLVVLLFKARQWLCLVPSEFLTHCARD